MKMIPCKYCFLLLMCGLFQCEELKLHGEEEILKEFRNVYSKSLYAISFSNVFSFLKNVKSRSRMEVLIRDPVQMYDVLNEEKFWIFNETYTHPSKQHACASDILYTMIHIKQQWAMQMLDSFGKIPSGILYGNNLWIGNYRECTETYVPKVGNTSFGNFHGQYCSAEWNMHFLSNVSIYDVPLNSGICIPDSCNAASVNNDLHYILQYLGHSSFIKKYSSMLSLRSLSCAPKYEILDVSTMNFIFILGLVTFLMTCGTLLTIYSGSVQSKILTEMYPSSNYVVNAPILEEGNFISRTTAPMGGSTITHELSESFDNRPLLTMGIGSNMSFLQHCKLLFLRFFSSFKSGICTLMKCFCVLTNVKKILNTENLDDQLTCINGIRFLSMAWIILGHTYVHSIYVVENVVDMVHDIDNWPFQIVARGTFCVDSFFLLSGFLMVHLFLKRADLSGGKINWLYLYIHRYLRLTPALMVALGFNILCFKHLGSGPFWYEHDDAYICKSNWWWNILYINNFLNLEEMCLAFTWYLANDMQFFMLSTFYLYILWRWPKIGMCIISILLLSCWISTWVISDVNKIVPLLAEMNGMRNATMYQDKILQAWDKMYSKPYSRIGPYLIGAFLAHVLYKINNKQKFIKPWHLFLGWCTAIFCTTSVIYGLYHVNGNQMMYNFYNALSRSSFSLGLAWVIFVCLTGHGGTVNQILSCKIWIPLSRVTYCVYLSHPLIMKWYFQNLKASMHYSQSVMVLHFLGFLCLSYAIGCVATIAFESPILNIEKKFFKISHVLRK